MPVNTIGVLLPDPSDPFYYTAIKGIEAMAEASGCAVLFGRSYDDERKERDLLTTMRSHGVGGFLIAVSKGGGNYEHFESLKKRDVPMVFFNSIPDMDDIHYIDCDMESGTRMALDFLLKKGHKSIGLINGPEDSPCSLRRREAYQTALKSRGITYDPGLEVTCDLSQTGTAQALEQLLSVKRSPSAVLAFNDLVAIYAARWAKSSGTKISRELTFVGYGNCPGWNSPKFMPVASVDQYPYRQGWKAADMLLELMNRPKSSEVGVKVTLEPKLVIRRRRGY